jgi:signal transduction histidine kinase
MTRLYYSAGRLRLKLILWIAACAAFFGLVETAATQRFLGLPSAQAGHLSLLVAAGAALLFVALSVFSWLTLRPTARLLHELRDTGATTQQREDPARFASLRFPLLLCGTALGAGVVLIAIAGVLSVRVIHASSELTAGLALSSMATLLLACAFLYVVSRHLIRPITLHFRHEDVPRGVRVSIRSKVLLAVVVTTLGSSLPTAFICARRVVLVREDAERQQLQHLAEVLAYSGTAINPDQLGELLASISLPRIRLRLSDQPGPTASPLPGGQAAAYLTAIGEAPPETDHLLLAIVVVIGLALASLAGVLIGSSLARDVARVAARVAAIARPAGEQQHAPLVAGIAQLSDVRRLGAAVNALLGRTAQIHVANFVAIERTLAANKLKMQFLANVSHDLRSPLNSILGFSELLLRDLPPDAEDRRRRVLGSIQRAGGDLLRLIDEVLDSAKLEAGRFVLQREDSLPAAVVRQSVQELQRQGIPEGIRLETELQAGLPTVWVDPQRLSQAILYLLRFCVDTAGEGEIYVRVTTQSLTQEHPSGARKLLLIRISSPAQLGEDRDLFEGFRRRPGLRGLGLGLPLAKAILELHDGSLSVHSVPHVGTTFAADLPVLHKKVLGRLREIQI